MEGTQQLAVIIPMLKHVGARIEPEQHDLRTPCASFTVADVLEHMTGLACAFAPAFRGEATPTGQAMPAASAAERISRFQDAMQDLLDSVESPGALDRVIDSPFGTMPGGTFARLVAFDGIIHGWDLASSTDQPWMPPDDIVTEVDDFARQALKPDMRDGDTFAAEATVSSDATPFERLVAFSGREIRERL